MQNIHSTNTTSSQHQLTSPQPNPGEHSDKSGSSRNIKIELPTKKTMLDETSNPETPAAADKKIQDERKTSTQATGNFLPVIKLGNKINAKAVDNDEAKTLWKLVYSKFRIIMNPTDYFNLTGSKSERGNININNVPYSVTTHDHLEQGQIMIPDVYNDTFPSNGEFELSVIAEQPIGIDSIIVTTREPDSAPIKSKPQPVRKCGFSKAFSDQLSSAPIPENKESSVLEKETRDCSLAPTSLDPDNLLSLNKHHLDQIVHQILGSDFIFEAGKQYPINILHNRLYTNSDDPIKNGTSESLPKKVHLSFSPSDHKRQALLNDKQIRLNPEFNKEQITNATRFISTNMTNIIFPSEGYRFFKPLEPSPKLIIDKRMTCDIAPKLSGDNRIHVSPKLLRLMANSQDFEQTRFLIKIGKYYYFTAADNDWGEDETHKFNAQTNLSFHANHPLKQKLRMSQSDKELIPAKNITIHLNWLSGDRKQLSLQEEMTTYVRKAMEEVPLQIGRVFQVPVVHVRLDKSGEDRFVLEAKVTAVTGNAVNGTSSAEHDSEPLFICDQDSILDLTAEETSILDGSVPAEATRDYYIEKLTSGLAGMEKYARKLVDDVIICRENYEKGQRDNYRKGVLLYGPMGNGKSDLAANLFHAIKSQEVTCCKHIKKAGSVIASTAKDTLANLDAMFSEAKRDQEKYGAHKAPLHVYLIDEIDGFLPLKKIDSSPVDNALGSYLKILLSSNDQALNNIIIIGTTNSTPDKFDDPLTRTGRFSVKIGIDNPDEVQRLDIMKYFISKSTPPTAFIDQETERMAARITANRSAIDIKSLIEDATELATKNPDSVQEKKLEISHIYEVLHPKDKVAFEKDSSLKTLEDQYSTHRDSVVFEQEEQALSALSEKISLVQAVPGRHQLFFVEGNKNSRTAQFCHDLLEKCNHIFGYHVSSSILDTVHSLSKSIKSHRSVVVLNNVKNLIEYHTENNESNALKNIGRTWDKVRLSKTSSTAFILTIPVGETSAVKSAFGIDHKYHDTCTLRDRFTREEMMQLLKNDYPDASNETVNEVVNLFGPSFPIKSFKELIYQYFYKEGQSIRWHTNRIREKLETENTFPNSHLYF